MIRGVLETASANTRFQLNPSQEEETNNHWDTTAVGGCVLLGLMYVLVRARMCSSISHKRKTSHSSCMQQRKLSSDLANSRNKRKLDQLAQILSTKNHVPVASHA
jgi:hypothetical protein